MLTGKYGSEVVPFTWQPTTVEHRSESDKGQMWRRKIGHDGETTRAGHPV